MADLELTLTWLGMDRYLERFIEAGFDSWETVLDITENDLDILNVDLGHRRKLQREIANSKRLARDPAFVTPLYGSNSLPSNTLRGISSSSNDVQQGGPPTKRGYRHHPKPDQNAPERPYSAYVLFSNHLREQMKEQSLSFADSSKVVGEKWQQLSRDEKEEWKKKGIVPWEKYKAELAEYQKTGDFREYQRYVTGFKAAQIAKIPQASRSTIMQNPESSTRQPTSFPSKHRPTGVSPTELSGSERKSSGVAIKRIKRDEKTWNQGSGSGTRSPRVRRACEPCRNRKIKCHAEQPTCRHCKQLGLGCYYASGKRDERRSPDEEVWQKLKAYEELLLKFSPQVDNEDQRALQDAMLMPPHHEATKGAHNETIQSGSGSSSRVGGGESDASGDGSMGPTDRIDRDEFTQQHSGDPVSAFLGQSSQTRWTERLNTELLPMHEANMSKSETRSKGLSLKSEPYAEDMDSAVVGHQIDPFSLPVKSTADSLVNAYFSTIHTSFPILDKTDFMNQYDQLFNTMDVEGFEHRTFIVKLQLVFAIAAVHAHLVGAEWTGDARDHTLYFSQARVLAVDTGILNDECYLSQVQVFGLGGMYLLVTNQLNRAWNMCGLAVRSAQALGLHLRDISRSVTAEAKELHAYNWFALMTLESMLTLVTGRPKMINPRDCTVPIPRLGATAKPPSTTTSPSASSYQKSVVDSKQGISSPGMSEYEKGSFLKNDTTRIAAVYFAHYAELGMLTMEVVSELYQPGIISKNQQEIQSIINGYDRRLFAWKDGVNPPLDVASPSPDSETESCRVALRILFFSTRIVIHRPCLCRNADRIKEHSRSQRDSIGSASKCVEAARATLDLILQKPDATTLREGTVWWMLVHHLKRALTVLLLELAFRAEHLPSNAGEIVAEAKAALRWLKHKGNSSLDALRTSSQMRKLLRLAAKKVGGDTSDLVSSDEEEEASGYAGQQQPRSVGYGNADQRAFVPSGFYGDGNFQEQWQYYGDLTAQNELDQFGFLRAEGGMGSLFPTASELDRMGEDYNMEGHF